MTCKPTGYLLRYGELALKKRNRKDFEASLMEILKPWVRGIHGQVMALHKKMLLKSDSPPEQIRRALSTVFGLTGISPVWEVAHRLDDIDEAAWTLLAPFAGGNQTFAVRTRRAFKGYPLTSIEIDREISSRLFSRGLDLAVDLKNPDLRLGISIELRCARLYLETWPGLGGLPVQRRNRCGLLLSGGLDSPVAGHMIQKRGAHLDCIYFHTPPYTVDAAKEKVMDLAQVLANYQNDLNLYVVDFSPIMKLLLDRFAQRYSVILSRRFMMQIAQAILLKNKGLALVTGESLGQVASQTLENIGAIGFGLKLPVLRPLIGFDKRDIIHWAHRIHTHEISVRPHQDCCSLFSPADPVTRASLPRVLAMQDELPVEQMLDQAVSTCEIVYLEPKIV